MTDFIDQVLPRGFFYKRLRGALARYHEVQAAGGWPLIAEGSVLKASMTDDRDQDRTRTNGFGTIYPNYSVRYPDSAVRAGELRSRIMNKKIWAIAAAFVWFSSAPLEAANLLFAKDSPIARMDAEDLELLKRTAREALEKEPDGTTVSWRNPNTDHFGDITIIDTHDDYGTVCRTVRFHNTAGGKTGRSIYRACKADDDTWRLAPRKQETN